MRVLLFDLCDDLMIGYLERDLSCFDIINCIFLTGGLCSIYKRNYVLIFGKNSNVRIKFDFMFLYMLSGIHFQMDLSISMPCGFLRGVPRN